MLDAHHLTRRFGDLVAVDDVSLTVPSGHLIGFVGGNGAGKTTTMRMLMGLLKPNAGDITWGGRPITAADRSQFGYMPEERGLYAKQPIIDQLVYLGRLHGMSRAAARGSALDILERFGLAERAKDKLEALSLGNQQRVQIAAAILHSPIALILDEPFSGLDPAAVDAMSDALRERAAEGVPVLFSSHQLDLVDRLCDGMIILAKGAVLAAGTSDDLRSRGRLRHRLVCEPDAGWVRDLRGVDVVDLEGPTALLELADDSAEQAVVAEAIRRGTLREFAPLRPSLGEIYREVTAA